MLVGRYVREQAVGHFLPQFNNIGIQRFAPLGQRQLVNALVRLGLTLTDVAQVAN